MAAIIFGLLLIALVLFVLGYAVVTICQGKNLPHHYFTIPLAALVGMFVMALVRNL